MQIKCDVKSLSAYLKSGSIKFGNLVLQHFKTIFCSQIWVVFLKEVQSVLGGRETIHKHEPVSGRDKIYLLGHLSGRPVFFNLSTYFTFCPYFSLIDMTCLAVKSRNVSSPFTFKRLLAKSRPIPVPNPPLSLSTTVADKRDVSGFAVISSVVIRSGAGEMVFSAIIPVSPDTCCKELLFCAYYVRKSIYRRGVVLSTWENTTCMELTKALKVDSKAEIAD